jgi:predicted P-loop ATPase
MTSKDAQIALMGKWCVLLDEMETWTKADHPIAKQFISRRIEKFRLPYDKFESEYPRQCVFAGTLNPVDGFLSDPTGNRRYWAVTVTGTIDIERLQKTRISCGQKHTNYRNAEKWWFKEELAKPYQEVRLQEDIWTSRVGSYINVHARHDDTRRELISPSIDAIATAEDGLNIPLGKCGTAERKRIGAIPGGWISYAVRKVDKKPVRLWVKPIASKGTLEDLP